MKAVYLVIQGVAFIIVGIGKIIKFLFYDVTYRLYTATLKNPSMEQRILLCTAFILYTIFISCFTPVLLGLLGCWAETISLVSFASAIPLISLVLGMVAAHDEVRYESNGRIPLERVTWYSFKDEKIKRQKEQEEKKQAAINAEEQKRMQDPDYVDGLREMGVLQRPKAIFDDSFAEEERKMLRGLPVSRAVRDYLKKEITNGG